MSVRIMTLGGAKVLRAGLEISAFQTQPLRAALLVYVAVEREVTRSQLISVFWADRTSARARHALSQTLYELRRSLDQDAPVVNGELVSLPMMEVDALEFEQHVEAGRYVEALAIYAGPFLDGTELARTVEFEHWQDRQRARFVRQQRTARRSVIEAAVSRGDLPAALAHAEAWATLDPLEDEAHHRIIELLAANGRRAAALEHFESYRRLLEGQLGVEPLEETGKLVSRIQAGDTESAAVDALALAHPLPEGARERGAQIREDIAQEQSTSTRPRRHVVTGLVAFALVVLGGGVFRMLADGRASPPPFANATDSGDVRTIAVTPFFISGGGPQEWREGMVDLISTNLSGIPGIRVVDPRTLLARWREDVAADAAPDLSAHLSVGRRAGSEYVLVGSVVAGTPDVRISAELFKSSGGPPIGQAVVVGRPDSIFSLVDRLSVQVATSLLGASRVPTIDLARVTTSSLTALRAYLEGEVLFRRSDFEGAIGPYERAVQADTTFALAFRRLSEAYSWGEFGGSEPGLRAIERAARFAGRLHDRDAALVEALLAWYRGTLDGVATLQEHLDRHPDDVSAWYLLGDSYLHLGDQLLLDASAAARAFDTAIHFDPTFTPPYIHRIDLAFHLQEDSAQVADLIDRFSRLANVNRAAQRARLAFDVIYGVGRSPSVVWEAADTVMTTDLRYIAQSALASPPLLALQEQLLLFIRDVGSAQHAEAATFLLLLNRLNRGRLEAAWSMLDDRRLSAPVRAAALYTAALNGLRVPEEFLDAALALDEHRPDAILAFYAGAHAAERGQEASYTRALDLLERTAAGLLATGDSSDWNFAAGMTLALRGLHEWRSGHPAQARVTLEEARLRAAGQGIRAIVNATIRTWTALILLEEGRLAEAAELYNSLSPSSNISPAASPIADLRLAQIYAALGRPADAEAAHLRFDQAWRHADAGVRDALNSIIRLNGTTDRHPAVDLR